MKRLVSLIMTVLLVALCLQSCSSDGVSLTINDVNVSEEIYNYYLAEAENNSEYKDSKDKEETAVELCKKYVAGSELIKKYGVSLTAEEKVSVSSETKAEWLYFKDFYEKYSVSKQTLNSMIEYNQLIEDLIVKIYSKDGENPLSEEEIKEYYDKNYIVAQIISADFKDESGNLADEETVNDITEKFTEMRNSVRAGESMETAAQKYPEFAEYDGDNSVIKSFDTSYPEGFFENVAQLGEGETQAFKYNDLIYLIHRPESAEGDIYFSLYRKECIVKMKKAELEKTINALAESYKIVYNKR